MEGVTHIDYVTAYKKFLKRTDQKKSFSEFLTNFIPSLQDRSSVLDIGSGSGVYLNLLSEYFSEVHAIEPVINLYRENEFNQNVKIQNIEFENYIPGRSFNLIVLSHSLYHLTESELEKLCNIYDDNVAPGGAMLVAVQCSRNPIVSSIERKNHSTFSAKMTKLCKYLGTPSLIHHQNCSVVICSENDRDSVKKIFGEAMSTNQNIDLPAFSNKFHVSCDQDIFVFRKALHENLIPISTSNENACVSFYKAEDQNGYLSNFYPCHIDFRGHTWSTSEHIYQGLKYDDPEVWSSLKLLYHPQQAADFVRGLRRNKPCEEILVKNMKTALMLKFSQNTHMMEKLVETYPLEIIEVSSIDGFWGIGAEGKGKNCMGKVLTEIRNLFAKTI